MGMFDVVKCEMPLPDDGASKVAEFQTKDFECLLNTITIEPDGTVRRGMVAPYNNFVFYGIGPRNEWIEYRAEYEMRVTKIERVADDPTTEKPNHESFRGHTGGE
jgi:hypothetical protein